MFRTRVYTTTPSLNSIRLKMKRKRTPVLAFFGIMGVLILLLFVLDIMLGSVNIPFKDFWGIIIGDEAVSNVSRQILIHFRLPKVITAILAGSALAVSGLQMQTIFRNPLAGPYVLGISSGASLGVAIAVLGSSAIGLGFWFGQIGVVLAALIGSMLILLLIVAVSIRIRDIMTILILGIIFGMATSAITSILQYFSSEGSLKTYVIWTMGSLSSVNGSQLWLFSGLVIIGQILAIALSRPLNVLSLGENYARSLGYNVEKIRLIVFVSTSLLAGTTTAFAGPIAFIGIAVPHIVRLILHTSNHAILIPSTLVTGASIMMLCDVIAQLPGSNLVLPINSVAALMGIPVVVYVILSKKRFAQH